MKVNDYCSALFTLEDLEVIDSSREAIKSGMPQLMHLDHLLKKLQVELETWKDIPAYERLYQVSNFGRVKSFKKCKPGKMIKLLDDGDGGKTVSLSNKIGIIKSIRVHKLVASAFLTKPEDKHIIIHKNGDKKDNRAQNLQWGTLEENAKLRSMLGLTPIGAACHQAKLQEPDIIKIRELARDRWRSQKSIALTYSVSQSLISDIIHRKKWRHVF